MILFPTKRKFGCVQNYVSTWRIRYLEKGNRKSRVFKLVHSVANVFVPFPSKRKFGCVRCKITLLTSRGNSMDIERGNENKWVHIVDTFSTPRFFSAIRDRTDGQSNEQDSKVRKTKRNTKKGLSMAGSRYRHVRPLSPMSRKMKRLVDHERLPDSGSTARLAKKRGRREGR